MKAPLVYTHVAISNWTSFQAIAAAAPRLSGATAEAASANPAGGPGTRPGRPAAISEQVQVGTGPGEPAAQRGVHLAVVVPAAGQRPGVA